MCKSNSVGRRLLEAPYAECNEVCGVLAAPHTMASGATPIYTLRQAYHRHRHLPLQAPPSSMSETWRCG